MPEWLKSYLDRASDERFYGKITLCYHEGNINDVKVEQNLKPADLGK